MKVQKKKQLVAKIIFILFLFLSLRQVSAQVATNTVGESIAEGASLTEELRAETFETKKNETVMSDDEKQSRKENGANDQASEKSNIIEQKTEVSPSVIDEQFFKSEIGKYSIKLKNNTEMKLDIYAMVNNVSVADGKLTFNTVNSKERAVSAANWILIKRGVIELMPNGETSVPLEIRVPQNAVPGKYYVSVSFPNGPNRVGAKKNMLNKSFSETLVNITINENVIEKAQVKKFITSRSLYLTKRVDFNFGVENLGNKVINPYGFIYITNRKGAEVAKIEILEGENNLGPGQISEIKKTWSEGLTLGKYKAKLELEYGKKSKRDLQDTIFFWVLPWQSLSLFIFLAIVLVALLTSIIFKKTYSRKDISEEKSSI